MAGGRVDEDGCFRCTEGELTEVEVATAKRNFQAYDVDQDGKVSRDDFHKAMTKYKEQLGERSPAEIDKMFDEISNGAEAVDFITFAEMRVRKKKGEQQQQPPQQGSLQRPQDVNKPKTAQRVCNIIPRFSCVKKRTPGPTRKNS